MHLQHGDHAMHAVLTTTGSCWFAGLSHAGKWNLTHRLWPRWTTSAAASTSCCASLLAPGLLILALHDTILEHRSWKCA